MEKVVLTVNEKLENLSFSFRALAKVAEKTIEENEALKAFIRSEIGSCATCEYLCCSLYDIPCKMCKYCNSGAKSDNWKFDIAKYGKRYE